MVKAASKSTQRWHIILYDISLYICMCRCIYIYDDITFNLVAPHAKFKNNTCPWPKLGILGPICKVWLELKTEDSVHESSRSQGEHPRYIKTPRYLGSASSIHYIHMRFSVLLMRCRLHTSEHFSEVLLNLHIAPKLDDFLVACGFKFFIRSYVT